MNIKQIGYFTIIFAMAVYISIWSGNFLKEYNPYFKNVNVYLIDIGMFIFCSMIFTTSYFFYDYGKYSKEFNEEYKDVEDKPHKQTYLEYVKERLKVERMMK